MFNAWRAWAAARGEERRERVEEEKRKRLMEKCLTAVMGERAGGQGRPKLGINFAGRPKTITTQGKTYTGAICDGKNSLIWRKIYQM